MIENRKCAELRSYIRRPPSIPGPFFVEYFFLSVAPWEPGGWIAHNVMGIRRAFHRLAFRLGALERHPDRRFLLNVWRWRWPTADRIREAHKLAARVSRYD